MASQREEQFKQLIAEFPDSPMGHFSLGKLYLEERRYPEAVGPLEKATALEGAYAAGLVALAEAYVGSGKLAEARSAFEKAKVAALAQKHEGLAEEIDDRLRDL